MNTKDFPMLKDDLIYLDSGATTLKPYCVIDKIVDYYSNYGANAHRGDYDISLRVDMEYENTREKICSFINASRPHEIIFTSGCTDSLNIIVNGFFRNILKSNDEVLICDSEHASNVIPWYMLERDKGIVVSKVLLDSDYVLTFKNIKKSITKRTKVISIAGISNVIGDERPLKKIISYAHKKGIYVVIDGAQSVPHVKCDVQELDCDFLTFSAHKMCGPTGIGVLYGKYELLDLIKPTRYGGGMNEEFLDSDNIVLKDLPYRLEAGTQNIAGIIGFGSAIDYLNNIGMDRITEYERYLKSYLVSKLRKFDYINIINGDVVGGIITFNVAGIASEDVAMYLNTYNICVRAGSHCTKMLKNELVSGDTVRISLYFYNTIDELDRVIELLSDYSRLEEFVIN